MGTRFRKSVNIGKHFRINLSKSGIGYSIGTKGFRVTKMANGRTRTTTSIPGTGISHVSETRSSSPSFDSHDTSSAFSVGSTKALWILPLLLACIVLPSVLSRCDFRKTPLSPSSVFGITLSSYDNLYATDESSPIITVYYGELVGSPEDIRLVADPSDVVELRMNGNQLGRAVFSVIPLRNGQCTVYAEYKDDRTEPITVYAIVTPYEPLASESHSSVGLVTSASAETVLTPESTAAPKTTVSLETSPSFDSTSSPETTSAPDTVFVYTPTVVYVLNTSTKVLHTSDCPRGPTKNIQYTTDRTGAISDGYRVCGYCNP